MRRNVRTHQYSENDEFSPTTYYETFQNVAESDEFFQMDRMSRSSGSNGNSAHRFDNAIEAKVEEGDTLQALALRFHCTVAEIKRLNKIDKDNEIHARKVVKIPVTVHSVLLGTLPAVHKSGNNSPKHHSNETSNDADELRMVKNPLEDAKAILSEKLMVASVNAAGASTSNKVNNAILNSKTTMSTTIYTDEDSSVSPHAAATLTDSCDAELPLLNDIMEDTTAPDLRQIRGPSLRAIDWSGSDCDMSWVCLFILILALCFVIPLVYVIYLAEHPHSHHHNSTLH